MTCQHSEKRPPSSLRLPLTGVKSAGFAAAEGIVEAS